MNRLKEGMARWMSIRPISNAVDSLIPSPQHGNGLLAAGLVLFTGAMKCVIQIRGMLWDSLA
jgi:hypothetical protein